MNSRRRISAPKLGGPHCTGSHENFDTRAEIWINRNFIWSGRRDSTPRPQPWQGRGQLPITSLAARPGLMLAAHRRDHVCNRLSLANGKRAGLAETDEGCALLAGSDLLLSGAGGRRRPPRPPPPP